MTGPRVELATLPNAVAVPQRHRPGGYVRHRVRRLPRHVLAALALLLVVAVTGIVSAAWMLRPRTDSAPPTATNFVPPPLPPEPAPPVAAAPPASGSTLPSPPLTTAKKPPQQPPRPQPRAQPTREAAVTRTRTPPPAARSSSSVAPKAVTPAPQTKSAPPPAQPPAATPVAPRVETQLPTPPPTAAAPPLVVPQSSAPPPAVTEKPAAVTENVVVTADRRGVETAVGRYRDGFSNLDAKAVHAVWPSANEKQLARAFGQLEDQRLEFHACDFDIKDSVAAATCTGVAAYVPKVGNKNPRFDDRRWVFSLKRAGGGWLIQDVVIR